MNTLDFTKVARLIDATATHGTEELLMLLDVLWRSEERQTAKVVVLIAGQTEDPLSPIGEACQRGLLTAAQLDKLCDRGHWREPKTVVDDPRCVALLNLIEERLANGHAEARRYRRYRAIRPRLWQAAEAERRNRTLEVERLEAMRDATVPDLWMLYRDFGSRIG